MKKIIVCVLMLLCTIAGQQVYSQEVLISLVDQAETGSAVGGIALSPDETKIYAAFWEDDNSSRVIKYSLPDVTVLQTFTFGDYHTHGDVVVSSDGNRFFTPNYYYSSVSQIDMANGNTRTDLSTVDSWPWGISITPDKTKVLVAVGEDGRNYDMNNDSIAIYDIANGNFSLLASVKLNDEPVGQIGFSDDSLYAYVCTYPRKSSSPTLYEISLHSPYAITRTKMFPNYNERICGVACIGNKVYVSGPGNSTISVVDRSAWTKQEYVVESPAAFLAVHPNHQYIFAYLPQRNAIRALDKNSMIEVGNYHGLRSSGGEFDKVIDIEFTNNGRTMYVSFRSIPGEILTFDINMNENNDTDGDGINDDEDNCPASDLKETIIINCCDSGIENQLFDDGCTMSDLIAECAEGAKNHGKFVSCVSHLTNGWKKNKMIRGKDKGAIQNCAAKLDSCEDEDVIEDDFEDGRIDTSKWVVGGSRGGTGGPNSGGGQWYNNEIIATDGYIQARATTPTSGNTYGAQAWTRTVYNFNDGKDWIINFKWEPDIQSPTPWHADYHLIEITNGRTDWSDGLYIHPTDVNKILPGTQQLYLSNGLDLSPRNWSIIIDASTDTATLYEGTNGTGTVRSVKPLDNGLPWYVRFITTTATSAGYPAKDCRFNLYDFTATPDK